MWDNSVSGDNILVERFIWDDEQYVGLYPNGNGGKIPYYSKIGTKLIVGFLIIACITGSVGYLSFNYSQTAGEKFHLLASQTIPTVNSLKQIKEAVLSIESATGNYVFAPFPNRDRFLQEILIQSYLIPICVTDLLFACIFLIPLSNVAETSALEYVNYTSYKYKIQFQYPTNWVQSEKISSRDRGPDISVSKLGNENGSSHGSLFWILRGNGTELGSDLQASTR